MDRKKLVLLLGALVIAIGTALAARSMFAGASAPQAQAVKTDSRLPIDTEARKQNRTLPTEKVLALLQQQDRRLWELAEVVGKWIWGSFSEQPAPTVRQTLAQLGFHGTARGRHGSIRAASSA